MKELRIEFEKEMSYIPDFIDSKLEEHYLLWVSIMDCNDILLMLIVDVVLKERPIMKIVNKFNDYVIETLYLAGDIKLQVAVYLTSMIDYLLERCLDEEAYEAAENIKNFNLLYYKNITIVND